MSRDLANLTPAQWRIRAAATSVGKDLAEVANAIGVSVKTLGAFGSEKYPLSSNPDRANAISETCGCPLAWLLQGWAVVHSEAPDKSATDERIQQIESELRRLRKNAITAEQVEGIVQLRLLGANRQRQTETSAPKRRESDGQAG